MNKKYLAFGVIATIFVIGCGGAEPSEDDANRLNDIVNDSAEPVAPPETNQITAGTWKVGRKEDIPAHVILPGEYAITTASDGINCYWERVKNFDEELTSIIANGNIDAGKTKIVNVKKTDKGLTLEGDCLAKRS